MPDVHSGYGFCIGNVAAFDMDDPEAVASPGKFKAWSFSETWSFTDLEKIENQELSFVV